jgi:hypothetical protein
MEGYEFDESAFFGAIAASGARALLIGRRALIALGIPVLTSDYDFWLHLDDIEVFNRCLAVFDLHPTHSPSEARARGRYVLENGEHVDVLLGRSVPTVQGEQIGFDDLWSRRQELEVSPGVRVAVPELADLEATKRFGARPKDAEDLRLIQALRRRVEGR